MGHDFPGPDDIRLAAAVCHKTLLPLADRDWSVLAGELEWSARETLEHVARTQLFYAAHLATRAQDPLPVPRRIDPDTSIADVLIVVQSRAAILADVVKAAPAEARAYHPWGMSNPSGCAAMGCDEIVVHTGDIARGFGVPFAPPESLCSRIVNRLFPRAPGEVDAWAALQWANGRLSLPGYARLEASWTWHCAPLELDQAERS
jgi:hypothetical protein